MRTRSSEYQRSYKKHTDFCWDFHNELVAYRNFRRDQEFQHQKIKWDSESSSSSSSSIQENADDQRSIPENGDGEPTLQIDGRGTESDSSAENGDSPPQVTRVHDLPGSSRSTSRPATAPERPPFISYGWADKELETARKQTHNVRANSKYVYPAALRRAKTLNNERIQQHSRSHSRAMVEAALRHKQKAEIDDVWMTEYQRCYSRQGKEQRPCSASEPNKRRRPESSRCTTRKRQSRR